MPVSLFFPRTPYLILLHRDLVAVLGLMTLSLGLQSRFKNATWSAASVVHILFSGKRLLPQWLSWEAETDCSGRLHQRFKGLQLAGITLTVSLPQPTCKITTGMAPNQWTSSLHQVAKVLEFQLQHQSFQWISGLSLGWTGWISMQSKGLSGVFSNTTVQ